MTGQRPEGDDASYEEARTAARFLTDRSLRRSERRLRGRNYPANRTHAALVQELESRSIRPLGRRWRLRTGKGGGQQ